MAFRVGQKVVCVNGKFGRDWDDARTPEESGIYTIRRIVDDFLFGDGSRETAVYLEEIVNPIEHYRDGEIAEPPFWMHRFRPIIERKTDISFAHDIIRKVSNGQGIDA